jgi:hypothetical protein
MSPITASAPWTKRLSWAQRSISATDFSTLCVGITIEPRNRSVLVEPFLDQPVVQRAAERSPRMSSENTIWHAVQLVCMMP